MKKLIIIITCAAFMFSCELLGGKVNLEKVQNPEKDIFRIFHDFELESVTKEDYDYDGKMDYSISGYDLDDNWIEAYFINNGGFFTTYRYMSSDEFWYDYDYYDDDYSEYYDSVEEYFYDMEDYSTVEDIFYGDMDGDGYDDAVVVAFYESEDYQSIDNYIFSGSDEGYYYFGIAEVHYPTSYADYSDYDDVVIEDDGYTINLSGDDPYWYRSITFKYDDYEGDYILFQDAGTIMDEDGNLVKEEVLTEDDFGTVYFYDFYADNQDLVSLQQDIWVSTVEEFLNALGNNKRIYLESGRYELDNLSDLPDEVHEAYDYADDWDEFYDNGSYIYTSGDTDYDELYLTFSNLKNTDIIGDGNVEFVVTDEFYTVLTFENCNDVYIENIYMVHDVGGICGANVVDIFDSENVEFYDCVFDGSGELGVYADACYSLYFDDCAFTNCTSGAVEFINSDAMFDYCDFMDNEIWNALIAGYDYSSLDFYSCKFMDNSSYDYGGNGDDGYLFYAQGESYIYIDYDCYIGQNDVDRQYNNDDYVLID